jgi:cytochrome c-type biogenesis protein
MEFLFTFLEGIASFISPCVLPMLPIYISYFAGKEDSKTSRALLNSIGFVIGNTIIFILFAIIASYAGALALGIQKYIKILFGVVIIILGLNYMGILKIKFLNKEIGIKKKIDDFTFFKTILFGMMFSISWTPCIGSFLGSALLLIANKQNILQGILLMLVYSIGFGIPFIISAVLIEKLKNFYNLIKKNYKTIKIISGIILIVMGVYVIFI